MDIIDIPAVLDDGAIGHEVEADLERSGGTPGRKVKLLFRPSGLDASVNTAGNLEPGSAAIGAAFDIDEVVAGFEFVLAPEMQRGVGHAGEIDSADHAHAGLCAVGVIRAGAVARAVAGRDGTGGVNPPRSGMSPSPVTVFKIVMEVSVGLVKPGKRGVVSNRHDETAAVARKRIIAGHGPTGAEVLDNHAVGHGGAGQPPGREGGSFHNRVCAGRRISGAEGRRHGQGIERIDSEGVRHGGRRPIVCIPGLRGRQRHPAMVGKRNIGAIGYHRLTRQHGQAHREARGRRGV